MDYREEAEVQNIKQRFGIIGISPKINNAIRTAIQVCLLYTSDAADE